MPRNYPKNLSATTAIPFDNPVSLIPPKTVTGAVTFTKVTTSAQAGYGSIIRVTANGLNVPDLSAFKSIGSGAYDNTNGVVNQLWFIYDGTDYCVSITQPVTIGGGGGDVTPPTIVSAEATDATHVTVVFSESVTATTGGWGLYIAELTTTYTMSSVSGSGTTWIFVVSTTMTSSQTLSLIYTASPSGNTVDTSSNELSDVSGFSVTNSIGGGGAINITFGAGTSSLTNTSQVFTPAAIDSGFNHTGVDAKKLPSGTTGRIWFKYVTSGDEFGILGFTTSSTLVSDYTTMIAGVYIDFAGGNTVKKITSGASATLSYTPTVGRYYGVYRDGSTGAFKVQESTDESTWSDIGTISSTSTADLFIQCSLFGESAAKMSFPKGENIS